MALVTAVLLHWEVVEADEDTLRCVATYEGNQRFRPTKAGSRITLRIREVLRPAHLYALSNMVEPRR